MQLLFIPWIKFYFIMCKLTRLSTSTGVVTHSEHSSVGSVWKRSTFVICRTAIKIYSGHVRNILNIYNCMSSWEHRYKTIAQDMQVYMYLNTTSMYYTFKNKPIYTKSKVPQIIGTVYYSHYLILLRKKKSTWPFTKYLLPY